MTGETSTNGGRGRGHRSPATEALRQGSGPGDGALLKIVRPGADDRWRPLKGGGVELVDRWGNPVGWAYVPLSRVAARREDEEGVR